MASIVTVPLNLALLVLNLGCTSVMGVLTLANGAVLVVHISINLTQTAWQLTKITLYGTSQIAKLAAAPLSWVAKFFSSSNPKEMLHNEVIALIKKELDLEAITDVWIRESFQMHMPNSNPGTREKLLQVEYNEAETTRLATIPLEAIAKHFSAIKEQENEFEDAVIIRKKDSDLDAITELWLQEAFQEPREISQENAETERIADEWIMEALKD